LVDQEVLELYFFPLFRVVGGGGSSSPGAFDWSGWALGIACSEGGATTPSGVIPVQSGATQVVSISLNQDYTFLCWTLDGVIIGVDTTVTVPSQADGTAHVLNGLVNGLVNKKIEFKVVNVGGS
jgi:hypothetical protein